MSSTHAHTQVLGSTCSKISKLLLISRKSSLVLSQVRGSLVTVLLSLGPFFPSLPLLFSSGLQYLFCYFLGLGLGLGVSVCLSLPSPPSSCAQFIMFNVQPSIIGSSPRCFRGLCASNYSRLGKCTYSSFVSFCQVHNRKEIWKKTPHLQHILCPPFLFCGAYFAGDGEKTHVPCHLSASAAT